MTRSSTARRSKVTRLCLSDTSHPLRSTLTLSDHMKDIQVYVRVPRYIKEWLVFHLGEPVRFPQRSYENELLHRHLDKRPEGIIPDKPAEDVVAIVITDCDHRRPEYYSGSAGEGLSSRLSTRSSGWTFGADARRSSTPKMKSTAGLTNGVPTTASLSTDARRCGRSSTASAAPTSKKASSSAIFTRRKLPLYRTDSNTTDTSLYGQDLHEPDAARSSALSRE